MIIAGLELRSNITRRRMEAEVRKPKITSEEAKKKLARFVADLFDEDIPFDELEQDGTPDNEELK